MDVIHSVTFLFIGAAAGWLAGLLMNGRGFGVLGDLTLGAVGAFGATFVARLIGLPLSNLWVALICATMGAVVLLGLIRTFKNI